MAPKARAGKKPRLAPVRPPRPSPEDATESGTAASAAFPLVAIGGSAGSLNGFKQIAASLPRDAGLTVIVLLHLDPGHPSVLAEMLTKSGELPFAPAVNGQQIEPNRGYVLPPGKQMTIAGDRIRVEARPEGRFLPIDHFMESLAEARGPAAIGVVLSGTDGDGTRGLGAIKAQDGVTFAQDATALFPSMPQGAIAAGAVDFVLPPEAIGRKLLDLARWRRAVTPIFPERDGGPGKPDKRTETPPGWHKPWMETIFSSLREAGGVDFSGYNPNFVVRRIRRRMEMRGGKNLGEYAGLLRANKPEAEALTRDLLLNVNRFFRNPEVFEALKTQVFPHFVGARKGPIRVWVAGCAAGQEAYSIAIALDEFLGGAAQPTVLIFGTDLDEMAIEQARMGVYPEALAAEISPERLRRYFSHESPHGYRIAKAIRDRCVFARHDLGVDPPLSNMNLVSCRNTLIYFGAAQRDRVLAQLHYALRSDGFLLLGASEGGPAAERLFTLSDRKHRIYRPHPGRPRRELELSAKSATFGQAGAVAAPRVGQLGVLAQADRVVLGEFAPAGVVVDSRLRVVQFRGRTGPYLEPLPGRASLDLFNLARPVLVPTLREAVDEARESGAPAYRDSAPLTRPGGPRSGARQIRCQVVPLAGEHKDSGYLLILFRPLAPPPPPRPARLASAEEARLRRELAGTESALRAARLEQAEVRENFEMAQEEAASANEELQAANEELETSKEELQSSNEELHTVNEELRTRNADLHRAQEFSAATFDALAQPLVVLDENLCLVRANHAFFSGFHLAPAAAVGKPLAEIGRGEWDTGALRGLLEGLRKDDPLRNFELARDDPEAGRRLLSVSARRIAETPDHRPALLLAIEDITETRRAEERLHARIDYLTVTAASFLVINAAGRVVFANAAAQSLTARAEKDILGHPAREVLRAMRADGQPYDSNSARSSSPLLRAISERRRVAGLEEKLQRATGEVFTARCAVTPLTSFGDPAVAVEIRDADNEARVSRELLASERLAMSGQVVASMAHEINNPLAAVVNAVYVLARMEKVEDPKALEFARIAESELARITRIVKSTLGLYGGLGDDTADLNPAELLDSTLTLLASRISRKNITVLRRFRSQRTLRAAPGEIRQVLANILTNAVDAAPNGGRVALTVSDSGAGCRPPRVGVRITISDNGQGIPVASLPMIFQPFFTTKGEKGTGLGLWVSSELIRRWNGRIRVRSSQKPGRSGSCFSLFFPS